MSERVPDGDAEKAGLRARCKVHCIRLSVDLDLEALLAICFSKNNLPPSPPRMKCFIIGKYREFYALQLQWVNRTVTASP